MRALATALALFIATPLAAQDRMTQALCEGSWQGAAALFNEARIEAEVRLDDENWCLVEAATIDVDTGTQVGLDHIRWRASDMARFAEDGLPPRALEVTARGIRVLPQTGDPVYDYLLGLQTRSGAGIGFDLSLRWDGLQDALLIDTATLTLDAANRIEISGRIDGVDLTDAASIQMSLGTAGLRDLLIKTQFDGWFETYVAVPLGVGVLRDDGVAPAAQVAALKRQAIEFIEALPEGIVPPTSRSALAAFITAMPQPRGAAQLQLSAQPTLSAARLMPLALRDPSSPLTETMGATLEGTTLLFSWSPTKETP